jgi:hypothetical protein
VAMTSAGVVSYGFSTPARMTGQWRAGQTAFRDAEMHGAASGLEKAVWRACAARRGYVLGLLTRRNAMPLRMAFCCTAAGVRPNAFATAVTGVRSLARRFSLRRSAVVHRSAKCAGRPLVVMLVTSMTAR